MSLDCYLMSQSGAKKRFRITNTEHCLGEPIRVTGYIIDFDGGNLELALKNKFSKSLNIIDRVIFNAPATIVIWSDGTKTVVKCQPGDEYSKENGLAMCIAKKHLGNKGNFNEVFKKFIEDYDPRENKKG